MAPITLATANCKIEVGEAGGTKYTEVKGITDISFKFDPKATILSSATHERAGTYWGPPELTIDLSAYAADTEESTASIPSILWHLLKVSQTREYFAIKFSVKLSAPRDFNSEIYIASLEADPVVVTAITPIKVGTDGVQTADFTITCLNWKFSSSNPSVSETIEADAVDPNGPEARAKAPH